MRSFKMVYSSLTGDTILVKSVAGLACQRAQEINTLTFR